MLVKISIQFATKIITVLGVSLGLSYIQIRVNTALAYFENIKRHEPNTKFSDIFDSNLRLKGEYAEHYPEYNAFQHAYSSAQIAYHEGKLVSEKFGYLKELIGWNAEGKDYRVEDTNRDLWNNQKGIEYATNGKENGKSLSDIAIDIFENIHSKQNSDFITKIHKDEDKENKETRRFKDNETIQYDDLKKWFSELDVKGFFKKLSSRMHEFFASFCKAQNAFTPPVDPILVDLNGDGIKTTTVGDGAYFDHQGDGFSEKGAWVDENDGILVIDKNNDGIINNGSEIFGDNYIKSNGNKATSGFDALRDLDSNNDGIISANDNEFNNIKILKGNGELITLDEAGIVSIDLNSVNKNMVFAEIAA